MGRNFTTVRFDTSTFKKNRLKLVSGDIQWRCNRYNMYGGRHTNQKFAMAASYQSAKICAVDFQKNN